MILCALAFIAAAGCGDEDEGAAGDDTSTTSSTTSSTTTTTTTTGDEQPLAQSCTNSVGFTIAYPETWTMVSDCGQFGAGQIEEPEPNTDERTGVVSAWVDRVPYSEAAEPQPDEVERTEATVAGEPAVRATVVEDGEGLYPEGTRQVIWMVDAPDAVQEPGTLFVTAVSTFPDVDFEEAVQTMDAMVETIEFTA